MEPKPRLHAVRNADNNGQDATAVSELRELLDSWLVHLRAERKSPNTITSYRTGVEMFLRWCGVNSVPARLDRRTVSAWLAEMLDSGTEATSVRLRQSALRGFSAWLLDEEEIEKDELRNLKPPKLDQKIVPALSDVELAALLKVCEAGKTFHHRRDEALVRLMIDCGARAGEVIAMQRADLDITNGAVHINRGKGGKGRVVPFGPKTGQAIDRYLRLRKAHALADSPHLWLAVRHHRPLAYSGLRDSLGARALAAGIEDFHLHRLRHSAATRWLEAGGSEGGLMAVGGWTRRDLIDRYTRDSAERRAGEEFRRLGLGEL